MRYRDIQEATATRKLTHGTDRGRMNEIILATAIFSKFVKGDPDVTVPYLTSALKLLAKSPTGLRNKKNPDNCLYEGHLPGPFAPPGRRRPSLNITALSYSCTTL